MRLDKTKLITPPALALPPPALRRSQGRALPFRPRRQAAEGALQAEVLEQLAQLRAGGDGQLLLQAAAIEGGAGMEQGVGGVAPAIQQLGGRFGQQQHQGREIGLQLPLQGQAARLRQVGPAAHLGHLLLPVAQGPAALLQAVAAAQAGQGLW